MKTSITHYLAVVITAAALTACLSEDAPKPTYDMCESTDDCSGTAICDNGVCWGDPPDTTLFAAVVIPPADRPDLAPAEIADIQIAPDGTISGLEFAQTIQFHGRVVIGCGVNQTEGCGPDALVPAQVVVERSSSFPGGPDYRRTVLTKVEAGSEEDSFTVSLPMDGQDYRVTIVPDEASLNSLADLGVQIQAPPYSMQITADADQEILVEIGKPDQLKTIQGCITTSTGSGSSFEGMRVHALGRWNQDDEPIRASSIVTTDAEGCFAIAVPIDMLNSFDIVARPGPGLTLPTLRLSNEDVPDPLVEGQGQTHYLEPLIMPNAANPVTFKLPLFGLSSGGAPEPISGATVTMETTFKLPASEERDIEVTFSAKATSNGIGEAEEGIAVIQLYPGSFEDNRSYTIRVLSPPNSEFSSVFATQIDIGTGEGVLEGLALERRVVVSGALAKYDSEPLPATPLTVRPSPLMRRALTTATDRAVLDNIQFASVLSGETGEFILWLDRDLLGLTAQYDFEFAPPDFSSAPTWTFEDIILDPDRAGQESVDLGVLTLPAASYARGSVRDPDGRLIPAAEVRWFQLPSPDECQSTATACDIPARLLGIWESDEEGQVVAVLPDP